MAPTLSDDLEQLKRDACRKMDAADDTHKRLRDRWDRLDGLYHNVGKWKNSLAEATRRSRDQYLHDGMQEFGAELFIPYSFTVVETVLPRMLSNRPKMLILPRTKSAEPNVEPVRLTIDAQQEQCGYELKLQTTGKSGLLYGLGVQKTWWRKDTPGKVQRMQQRPITRQVGPLSLPTRDFEWMPVEIDDPEAWDDPDTADVSVYDFLWDPYGDSMDTVEYVIQRAWRSTPYVLDKIKRGQWPLMPDLTAEDIGTHSSKAKYAETWNQRRAVQGDNANFKEDIHEVLEVWTRSRVTVIVDREWPVAHFNNPHPKGRLPFHIYRPTEVLHQFCGKGEIEPIQDLQYEMNALRTDRRWNALMVLHKAFWYEDGTIDPATVKLGPGVMNPVNSGGNLNDILKEISPGDIPFSSYRETDEMKADIDRTTGISDPAQGVGDAGQTATGVQLVQAAAGVRIQNKTRRLEVELISRQARDFLALNQQRISEAREVRVPLPPAPGVPDRRYEWFRVGPAELAGEFDIVCEGGSTAPENVPQQRQDAQLMMQMLPMAQGMIDARKWLILAIRNLGIDQPEAYLSPMQSLPPQTLDYLQHALTDQYGLVDPEGAHEIISGAVEAAMADAAKSEQAPGAPQPGGSPVPGPSQAAA